MVILSADKAEAVHALAGDQWWSVVLGGAVAFAEAILGVGIVMPGELMVTGLAASLNGVWLVPFGMLVVVGASLGDHMNYVLGRLSGSRLADSRIVHRIGRAHWDSAQELINRHGAQAIVISRMVPVVRTLMPAVAGASGLSYARFLPASLIGSTLWAVLWISAGGAVSGLAAKPWLLGPAALAVVAFWLAARRRGWRGRGAGAPPAPLGGLPPVPTVSHLASSAADGRALGVPSPAVAGPPDVR